MRTTLGTGQRESQEVRRQAGELIHRDTVKAILAELVTPLRAALVDLPAAERTRCNPQSPDVAQKALTLWRDRLLDALNKAASKF